MKKIAVLASGRGSNLMALHKATKDERLDAQISLVISNKEKAPALNFCRSNSIPFLVIKPKDFKNRDEFFAYIGDQIEKADADIIVLAGFMVLVSQGFVQRFRNIVLNIHPALLPSFPGLNAQAQAFEHGVKVSGCTVFFVDEGCDTGPIIMQRAVEVKENDTTDTLSDRILAQEHDILWKACKLVLEGRCQIVGRRVKILEEK